MLSRVADSLYWLSRYIERAENLARLVDVNRYVALDAGIDDPWKAVLQATCTEESYATALEKGKASENVGRFITLDPANPDSIRACISMARENGRMVRDQISLEMWLELNAIHLYFQRGEAEAQWLDDPDAFYRRIIDFSLLFQGLTDSTVLHDEGWRFLQLGKFVERADKTSRILDMLNYGPKADRFQCSAVLSACSGVAAFRHEFRGEISLRNVTELILCSESFPRSVRFCLRRLDKTLHAISGSASGSFSNEAERLAGSLLARFNFTSADELIETSLHDSIDLLQSDLNDIGQLIFETYVLLPFEVDADAPSRPTPIPQTQKQTQTQR